MAVNYGLGGFDNGTAYVNGANSVTTIVSISAADEWMAIEVDWVVDPFRNFNNTAENFSPQIDGYYYVKYSVTTTDATNDDLEIGIMVGGTTVLSGGRQTANSKAGDYFTTNSSTIVKIRGGTLIGLAARNLSDTSDISVENATINIIRVGDIASLTTTYLAGNAWGTTYLSGGTVSYAAQDVFYPVISTLITSGTQQVLLSTAGDQFKILQAGFYLFEASLSTAGNANDNLCLGIMKNGSNDGDVLEYPQQPFNSKGGSFFQTGINTILKLKKDDTIMLGIKNETDATGNTTIENFNMSLIRIGNI